MAAIDEHGKQTPSNWREQIDAFINADGLQNTLCADCLIDATNSMWSVWNHGVFVCIKCAGIHRMIGVDISKVLTHTLPVDDFQEAFEIMDSGNCGKVILEW